MPFIVRLLLSISRYSMSNRVLSYSELATTMHELSVPSLGPSRSAEDLEVIFKEMVQMCLWYVALSLNLIRLSDIAG